MASLVIIDPNGGEHTIELLPQEYIIGRDPDAPISLPQKKVSRHHARIVPHQGGFLLEDLNSSNGVYVNGRRIGEPILLTDGVACVIGTYHLLFVAQPAQRSDPPFILHGASQVVSGQSFPLFSGSVTLGRSESNDISILDKSLSRKHVEITVRSGQLYVRDLESRNGLFVNGERVTDIAITENDRLTVGSVNFQIERLGVLNAPVSAHSGAAMSAWLSHNHTLLALGTVVLSFIMMVVAMSSGTAADPRWEQFLSQSESQFLTANALVATDIKMAEQKFTMLLQRDPGHEAGRQALQKLWP